MIADDLSGTRELTKRHNLPASMVAELELNSVIPSPDTIEEVRKSLGLNIPRQSLNHIIQPKVW
jgi:hypothetical protein